MFFSSLDGSFMTQFTYNASIMNVTVNPDGSSYEQPAYTEIYLNPAVWYPDGYKWVWSYPKSGSPWEGMFVNTTNGHYLQFWMWDPNMYNLEDANILITPIMNETALSGHIESTNDGEYTMDYTYTD